MTIVRPAGLAVGLIHGKHFSVTVWLDHASWYIFRKSTAFRLLFPNGIFIFSLKLWYMWMKDNMNPLPLPHILLSPLGSQQILEPCFGHLGSDRPPTSISSHAINCYKLNWWTIDTQTKNITIFLFWKICETICISGRILIEFWKRKISYAKYSLDLSNTGI